MEMGRVIECYFNRKLNPKRIKKYLEEINPNLGYRERDQDHIVVSCVQRSIKLVGRIEEYIDLVDSFISQAAKRGSGLIVFPEYNFFDLLGILPGIRSINAYLNKKFSPAERNNSTDGSNKGNAFLQEFFFSVAKPIQNAIEIIMGGLARKYRIYVYTGSYLIREEDGLYNGGAIISPQGEILGVQKKLHLTDFEEGLGIKRGDFLNVFQLDIGKVACPICMDATYFETFKLARSLGCDLVILPIANNEEYNLFRALRGIWPRVQESYVFGLKPSLNGWLCGLHFTGKAGIFAPLEITDRKDGIISMAKKDEGDFMITGRINLKDLYRVRQNDEYYGDVNTEFEKNYFINTYKGV
jgi:predicted amidohydrolase